MVLIADAIHDKIDHVTASTLEADVIGQAMVLHKQRTRAQKSRSLLP